MSESVVTPPPRSTYLWSVFTKPWSGLPGDQLGRLVAELGFGGAEVAVRDTAYVTPADAEAELPKYAEQLRAEGIEPVSVASDLSERVFAACAQAGVPMIRIMAELGPDGYAASVRRTRGLLEEAAILAAQYDVQVGIQPHHGKFVPSTLGVLQLLDGLPDQFKLVWDAAHDALAGDDPAITLELGAGRLGIVNLKNAQYIRTADGWTTHFVPGDEGMSDWSAVFATLRRLGWSGPICLTGQYSDPAVPVEERIAKDLRDARVTSSGGVPSVG
ncbi:sugar phosphate isomerase/epimerase [Kribbella turkmenica]|uniref:Sugar phosphate isomerase/epimerase n=1 Tax=Kribbella turkmenica TaxID=2530375 RepID=A0A4R4XFA7_9ACTN|nr:sugar phosphate isomerase/epimerase family protein [Kribbella turkmenica]TDD29571.1 sugar phosphate isomerase/epimerase [Kribbella turkmenica]